MDLKTTIQNEMKAAMKGGDALKVGALRMLIARAFSVLCFPLRYGSSCAISAYVSGRYIWPNVL